MDIIANIVNNVIVSVIATFCKLHTKTVYENNAHTLTYEKLITVVVKVLVTVNDIVISLPQYHIPVRIVNTHCQSILEDNERLASQQIPPTDLQSKTARGPTANANPINILLNPVLNIINTYRRLQ